MLAAVRWALAMSAVTTNTALAKPPQPQRAAGHNMLLTNDSQVNDWVFISYHNPRSKELTNSEGTPSKNVGLTLTQPSL